MYKGSIEPLYVVVLGEGEQDLTANDGEGEQQDCSPRHSQGEGTQVQPTGGARETSCYIIPFYAARLKVHSYNLQWAPVIQPFIHNMHFYTAGLKVHRNNLQVVPDICNMHYYI